MKLHFSPLRNRRTKRFFKRVPMDTGLDWEMAGYAPATASRDLSIKSEYIH